MARILRHLVREWASLSRSGVEALSRGSGEYHHNYSNSRFHFNQFAYGGFTTVAAVVGGLGACLTLSPSPTFTRLEADGEDTTSDSTALNPHKWMEFKLHEVARVSHNTKIFRFTFDPEKNFGLDVASCILTRVPNVASADGKYIIRPYTPISDPDSKGYFDLLVKIYPEGKMSQHLDTLKVGDVLEVKGPIEKLRYSPNMKKQIGMIAGGSGITPMLQILNAILRNPDDNTQVSLIYANTSSEDILLKAELNRLALAHPNFKVFYTVDNPSTKWNGGTGYITKEMIMKGLPGAGDDTLILVCGPPGMMKHVSGDKAKDYSQGEVQGLLKEIGYTEAMVYKF